MSKDFALELKGVKKFYPDFTLDIGSLKARRGVITGLVGRNGAGKSTLLKVISGMLERDGGEILYNGLKMWEHEVEVKSSVCCVYNRFEAGSITARQYAQALAAMYEKFDMDYFDDIVRRCELSASTNLNECSTGTKNCSKSF